MAIQNIKGRLYIVPNRSSGSNEIIFADLARRGVMIEGNITNILVEGVKGKVEALLVEKKDLETFNIHSKEFNMKIRLYRLKDGEDRARPYRLYQRGQTKKTSKFKGARREIGKQIRRRQEG